MNPTTYGYVRHIADGFVTVEADAYISANGKASPPTQKYMTCDLPPPHPVCNVGDRMKLEYRKDSDATGWIGSVVTCETVIADLVQKYGPLYDELTTGDLQACMVAADAGIALAGLSAGDRARQVFEVTDLALRAILNGLAR